MSKSQEARNDEDRFQEALGWISRLRKESFNQETETKLASHPYLKAAQAGTLTMAQKRAFVCEQLAIQQSDAASFAHLAGHRGFAPTSLVSVAQAPTLPHVPPPPKYKAHDDLFQFLLGGEIYAARLLLDHAEYLGLKGGEETIRKERHLSPLAQAYPSYWARLALSNQRAAGAAACAVNFPAWGRMCHGVLEAYQKHDEDNATKEKDTQKGLAFIEFFATPIDNLDEMAAAIMMHSIQSDKENEYCSYEAMAGHVRLLQEYELLFWDACYNAK